MRKRFLLLSSLVLCLLLCACGTKQDETIANSEIELNTATEETVALTEKEQIEKILRGRIEEEYMKAMEDEKFYIALVHLTWNTRNSGKLSKEVLKMYSDDLAAALAKENNSVREIAIFWTVPYLNDKAKCSYERVSNGFRVMDEMLGGAFS